MRPISFSYHTEFPRSVTVKAGPNSLVHYTILIYTQTMCVEWGMDPVEKAVAWDSGTKICYINAYRAECSLPPTICVTPKDRLVFFHCIFLWQSGTADTNKVLIFTLCIIIETRFPVIMLLEFTKQFGSRTIKSEQRKSRRSQVLVK